MFTDTPTIMNKLTGSIIAVALLAIGLAGCDSLTDGFDENPNLPTDATADLVLNSAQVATILFHDGNHARIASMWTEQLDGSDRQYSGTDAPGYNLTATDVNNIWITGYAEANGDLNVVKEKAREANNNLLLGIAQTIQAMNFGTKTALHGSVPFTDAMQGNDQLNPDFDPQLEIYRAVIDTLDVAVENIEAGGISPEGRDEFFQGSQSDWIAAANTLKARYSLHVAHVDEGPVADVDFSDVYNATLEGIDEPSGDLLAPHGNSLGVDANPFAQFRSERGEDLTAQNSYAASLLDQNTDFYRGDAKTDESARFANYFVGTSPDYDMNFDEGAFFASATDYPITTHAENELIKAEAALHAGEGVDVALDALNAARAANDARFGPGLYDDYEIADFEDGGIANPDGLTPEQALLKEILEEKYLTVFASIETFNDLRRTENYAEILNSTGGLDPSEPEVLTDFPQRFPIAEGEVNGNENTPDPIPGIFDVTPANQASYPTP